VVLILFDLDLKIYLNGLENKCKKKRTSLPVQLAVWKPTRTGLLLPSLAVGPSLTEPLPLFFSRQRGPA
jgi:hypothetical protein